MDDKKNYNETIKELAKFPVLEGIDHKYLAKMAELSKVRRYDKDQTIIKEGQTDNWIYFLLDGKVQVLKNNEEIATFTHQGDLFGEMRVMDGTHRSATIIAMSDTTCLAVDASLIDKMTGNDKVAFGGIMYKVFALLLAHRLRQSDAELVRLKAENAELKISASN